MKRYLLLLLLLLPLANALEITEPITNITTQTLPVQINASWTGGEPLYTVWVLEDNATLHVNETTNDTTTTFDLSQGMYYMTVLTNNTTTTQVFSVIYEEPENETEPLELSIETSREAYDLGEAVQFTVSANRQVTANLNIVKDQQQIESYTLNIASTLTFVYIPEEAGDFTATLTAEDQSHETTFAVEQQEPLTSDFTYTAPEINQETIFSATAEGGDAPYEYRWIFSDDTTSEGQNVSHYFFTAGEHSATLVVTDNSGTLSSVTKNFTVAQKRYRAEITVQNTIGENLENIKVRLTDPQGDKQSQKTDITGTVVFTELLGNYTLELLRIDEIYLTEDITIDKDENFLYTITTVSNDTNSTNTTVETNATNTTNSTNSTNTTAPAEITEVELQTTAQPEPEPVVEEVDPEEQARLELEDNRQEALTSIDETLFGLKLSAKKDELMKLTGIEKTFNQVKEGIRTAENEQQIEELFSKLPKSIELLDERTKVSYPKEAELDEYIQKFLEAKGIEDKKLISSYEYSIKEFAKNVSIQETILEAMIQYEGENIKYTIIKKSLTTPDDFSAIEFIPKSFAKDVSELRIAGNFEIIESDPIISFRVREYSYTKEGDLYDPTYTLVVPDDLIEKNLLTGLLSVQLGKGDSNRSWIYIIVLLVVGGLFGMNTYIQRRRKSTAMFNDFAVLASQALDMINEGDRVRAANLTFDIVQIFNELPPEQQGEIHEIIQHLDFNKREQDFILHVQEAHVTITKHQDDINVISGVYEDVLSHYEHLPEPIKELVHTELEGLDAFLDTEVEHEE